MAVFDRPTHYIILKLTYIPLLPTDLLLQINSLIKFRSKIKKADTLRLHLTIYYAVSRICHCFNSFINSDFVFVGQLSEMFNQIGFVRCNL